MWMYPPPNGPQMPPGPNPFVPSLTPGAGPFQPFPGGPFYRVNPQGYLEIYTDGVWTTKPQTGPGNRPFPNQPPPGRGIGPKVGGGLAGAAALYDSLKRLWDTMQALHAENDAMAVAIEIGGVADRKLQCAQQWVNWENNHFMGQQFKATYNNICANIITCQAEIDKLLEIPDPRPQAAYARVAMLKHAIANMVRSVEYYKSLRSDYIHYCGTGGGPQLPNEDQVGAFKCPEIPLETAPYPTHIVPPTEMATVPDNPPAGSGPLFPGAQYPKIGPLFPTGPDGDMDGMGAGNPTQTDGTGTSDVEIPHGTID